MFPLNVLVRISGFLRVKVIMELIEAIKLVLGRIKELTRLTIKCLQTKRFSRIQVILENEKEVGKSALLMLDK